MKGFVGNIEDRTEENADFRRVLYTGTQMQLVLMSLRPGEEIGEEVHGEGAKLLGVGKGEGVGWIVGDRTKIEGEWLSSSPPARSTTTEQVSRL